MAGLAFGIPVVTVVTMLLGYARLTSRGSAWWDDEVGTKVESRNVGLTRLAIVLVFVALVWALRVAEIARAL